MATIRKNGKAYDSGDVLINLLGSVESEVKSLTYSTTQEHQRNHSLANDATSWSMGKVNQEASIELYLNSTRKLENLAGGDLLKLAPFDIVVSFVNAFNDLITDRLTVKFQSTGRQISGDMGLAFQHDLFVLGVEYNI